MTMLIKRLTVEEDERHQVNSEPRGEEGSGRDRSGRDDETNRAARR
jgi:hypothetical protein